MNAAEIAMDAIEKKRKITEEENIQMCKELGITETCEWRGRTSDGKYISGMLYMAKVGSKIKGKYDPEGKLFAVEIDGNSFGVNRFLAYVALGKIKITATRAEYQKWQER